MRRGYRTTETCWVPLGICLTHIHVFKVKAFSSKTQIYLVQLQNSTHFNNLYLHAAFGRLQVKSRSSRCSSRTTTPWICRRGITMPRWWLLSPEDAMKSVRQMLSSLFAPVLWRSRRTSPSIKRETLKVRCPRSLQWADLLHCFTIIVNQTGYRHVVMSVIVIEFSCVLCTNILSWAPKQMWMVCKYKYLICCGCLIGMIVNSVILYAFSTFPVLPNHPARPASRRRRKPFRTTATYCISFCCLSERERELFWSTCKGYSRCTFYVILLLSIFLIYGRHTNPQDTYCLSCMKWPACECVRC